MPSMGEHSERNGKKALVLPALAKQLTGRASHGGPVVDVGVLVRTEDRVRAFGRLRAGPVLDTPAQVAGDPVAEESLGALVLDVALRLAYVARNDHFRSVH